MTPLITQIGDISMLPRTAGSQYFYDSGMITLSLWDRAMYRVSWTAKLQLCWRREMLLCND